MQNRCLQPKIFDLASLSSFVILLQHTSPVTCSSAFFRLPLRSGVWSKLRSSSRSALVENLSARSEGLHKKLGQGNMTWWSIAFLQHLCKSDWDLIQISDPSKTAVHWHLPRLKHRWNSFPCSSSMRNMKNPKLNQNGQKWIGIQLQ